MPPAGGIRRRARIVNERGLHARAAARFSALAERFDAAVTVTAGDETVSGLSIMGLLALGAGRGSTIVIGAAGPDARAAVTALAELVKDGFGE